MRKVLQQDGHGLTAFDRPDIINQVFQLKVDTLVYDLRHKHIFGRHMAHCYKLEYQKRGLPHVHLLLFLHENHSYLDSTTINKIILAEFPDIYVEPELYEVISGTMVHGPCGEENPKCACMTQGPPGNKKCSKGFPKAFSEQTLLAHNSYPVYCRRAGVGTPMTIPDPRNPQRLMEIDYRWVVPYSPYLCKKYNAHINVEICGGITTIKYIYGYIYKGEGTITLHMRDERSKIESYVAARYIGPNEAHWNLSEGFVHGKWPPVTRLDVHLPNQQLVYWDENATAEQVQRRLQSSSTTSTYFFEYNRTHPAKPAMLHERFPEEDVWTGMQWKQREQNFSISRLYHANLIQGECFYLRMLLTV